jgi:YHS domain-containing protein
MKHIDPVCGMVVKEETAKGSYDYKGKKYYFCSNECLEAFKKDPEKYTKEGPVHKMPGK